MMILDELYQIVWGMPLVLSVVGTGIYFTLSLKGLQFRYLPYALKLAFWSPSGKKQKGDISRFQALMTNLAGTIGIGNIAGVSTALTVGGLGALFWMWMTAIIGMATIYAEALLAVRYRQLDERSEMCGGPMYFIQNGLGWRWLAILFALFGTIAAFGGGNLIQANSVADAMESVFGTAPWVSSLVLALLVGMTLIGGIKSIGRVASLLVPFMALLYIGGACAVLFFSFQKIPSAIGLIFSEAFSGSAAAGGFLGASVTTALRTGVSRGLMTSEAGLGTASMAAAAAKTDHPARQALAQMTTGFLATVVLCSVTGLVLATSGLIGVVGANGQLLTGAALTTAAFAASLPWGGELVAIALTLFAITTLLGWAYYGEKCCEYLFGERFVVPYRAFFCLMIIPGGLFDLTTVWKVSDITNGLMAFPNLIGVLALSKVVVVETRHFFQVVDRAAVRTA